MSYKHYGEIGDIWKHLPLCEVITMERPTVYVETNSAYSQYSLDRTPAQEYGIFNVIGKAEAFPSLQESAYYKLIKPFVMEGKYLGSPGLAMTFLNNITESFVFFDLEKEALENITSFANERNIHGQVRVINKDSVSGLLEMLPTLPPSTFIHIDPYLIDDPNAEGKTYLDVFIKASVQGLKCFLWYGFETLNDKDYLNTLVRERLSEAQITSAHCCELMMESIQQNSVVCNPGVVGCGVLTSNLSSNANKAISEMADLVVALYRGTSYDGFKGDLYKDIIGNNDADFV